MQGKTLPSKRFWVTLRLSAPSWIDGPANCGSIAQGRTKYGKSICVTGRPWRKEHQFTEVGAGLWAFTAEGDPNSGVIIGDDCVMIVEAQATPRLARKVVEKGREVTDNPISHVALAHRHAVRVLGPSAFGAEPIIIEDVTHTYDKLRRIGTPPIRTAQRDLEMWEQLQG